MVSYVINLKHRVDRLVEISTEMHKLPEVQFSVVEAVYDVVGWRGCFLSHKKCITNALEQGHDKILIIEDDAFFIDDAENVLRKAMEDARNISWDMFYLGANVTTPVTRITPNLLKLDSAHTTHAYMISSSLYETVLSFELNQPIDVYYHNLMRERTVLMCDPMIAYQRPSHSDVEGGYRDYVNLLVTRYNNNIR